MVAASYSAISPENSSSIDFSFPPELLALLFVADRQDASAREQVVHLLGQ